MLVLFLNTDVEFIITKNSTTSWNGFLLFFSDSSTCLHEFWRIGEAPATKSGIRRKKWWASRRWSQNTNHWRTNVSWTSQSGKNISAAEVQGFHGKGRTLFGKPPKGSESLVNLRGLGTWLFWQNPGCLLFPRLYETNTEVYFVSFILISSFLRP